MVHTSNSRLIGVTLLLATLSVVLAHDHDGHAGDHADEPANVESAPNSVSAASMTSGGASPQSYFTYPALRGLMLGHIVLMTIAWFFVLPIGKHISMQRLFSSANRCTVGVMLSVARSRLALAVQLSFLGLHSVGLLIGTIYSAKTPDLYENNAHNKLGWIVTWIVVAQCIIGIVRLAVKLKESQEVDAEKQDAFLPISTEALAQHHQATYSTDEYRYSRDSGHFTASEASRSQSISSIHDHEEEEQQKLLEYQNQDADTDAKYMEKQGFLGNSKAQCIASRLAARMSQRTTKGLVAAYKVIDCVILLLGFAAIVSGVVVYGGVFVSYDQSSHPRSHHS